MKQTTASPSADENEKQTTASSDKGVKQTPAVSSNGVKQTTASSLSDNGETNIRVNSDQSKKLAEITPQPSTDLSLSTSMLGNTSQTANLEILNPEIPNIVNEEIKALYESNIKLKNEIGKMKLKETEMSAKYEATMDRLALADAELLSECRSSPNDDKKHRLEHRNQKDTVKEFKKLEKKYLEVKKQLSETCDEKDQLKVDLVKCEHQRETIGNILEDVMRKNNDTGKLAEAKVLEAGAKEELSKVVDTNEKLKEKIKEHQKTVSKLKTSYSTLEKENETLKREKDLDEGIKANNKLLIELAREKIKTLEDEIAKLIQINFSDKSSPSTEENSFITIDELQPSSHYPDSRDLNHSESNEDIHQAETQSLHPPSSDDNEEIEEYDHFESVVIYSSKYSQADMASSRIRTWQLIGSPKSTKKKPTNQLSAHPITLQNRFEPIASRSSEETSSNQQPPQAVPTRIDPLQHHHIEPRNSTISEQLQEYRQSMKAIYHNPPPKINNYNHIKVAEENYRQEKIDRRACQYYLKGTCKYGNRCYNIHPDLTDNTGYWLRGFTPLKTSNTPNTSVITEPQLTNTASRKKSIPCRYFIQNRCKHSKDTCNYSHTHPLTLRK